MTSTLSVPEMKPVTLECGFRRVSVGSEKLSVGLTFRRGAFETNGEPVVAAADRLLTNRRLSLHMTNRIKQGDLFAEENDGELIDVDVIVDTNSLSCQEGAFSLTCNMIRAELSEQQTNDIIALAQSGGSIVLTDSQGKPEKAKKAKEPGGEDDETSGAGTYLANVIDGKGLVLTAAQVASLTNAGFPTEREQLFAWFEKHAKNEHEDSEIKALTRVKGVSIARAERLREALLTEMSSSSNQDVIRLQDCQTVTCCESGAVTCDIHLYNAGSKKWLWGIDLSIGDVLIGFVPVADPEHKDHMQESTKKAAKTAALADLLGQVKKASEDAEFAAHKTDLVACVSHLK